MQKISVYILA